MSSEPARRLWLTCEIPAKSDAGKHRYWKRQSALDVAAITPAVSMETAGVIGPGDMGSSLAKNIIKNGFETSGFDLDKTRMAAFAEMDDHAKGTAGEVEAHADCVFVMVINGDQARDVILGDDGLVANMAPGGTVILSATIKPAEARPIGQDMDGSDIHLIDSPVSGVFLVLRAAHSR